MTRKTFEAVAKAVHKQLRRNRNNRFETLRIQLVVEHFERLAVADNPRFNSKLFKDACITGTVK